MANDDRRYPANLRGILAFCTENTKTEDAPNAGNFVQMDPERREWLAQAIEAMRGTDPIKLMLQDIQVLLKYSNSEDDIEQKELALEELQQYTEDLDLANDFHKIGGFHILPSLLRSSHSGFRWRAADLIATITQNNPYCQQEVLDFQLLPLLLSLVDNSSEEEIVRIKALYAVSCLTRESEASLNEFVKLDGFSYLLRAIQADIEKLQTKAAFMISALCQQQPSLKQTLCDMGMVEQLVGLLSLPHQRFHEHLVSALYYIVADNRQAQLECLRSEFKLQSLLTEQKVLLAEKEECQDELHCVNLLFNICFNEKDDDQVAGDR